MAASNPAERKVLDLLLRSGFISEDQLDKTVQGGGQALQALLDFGLVSEPTLVSVVGIELKFRRFEEEGIDQFIDRVYESTEPDR